MTTTGGANILRLMRRVVIPLLIFAGGLAAAGEVSFNRDVRPILSNNCYFCHGTDPNHRKGDRRLDTPEGAVAKIDGVRAVVPGKPEDSELIARILSDDPEMVMPPPKSNKSITSAEKEILRRWIAEGAKYEPHWAFVAPVRPPVPAGLNAIDHFVGTSLKKNGLSFSPREENGALLRRATLDLTGLPPTLAEIEQASPDSYEASIDRLLASPRYGERMALDWLDAARYADTNGYQGDAYRMNWPWRDWVVNAFNDNMPFDRFTIEQLAGDLLEKPNQDQLVATAFNRNHMLNAEGGTIHEENRTKYVFDRVETTSGVWLGLTIQCCQCHDHKFDPLKQSEYYSMYAFFNQVGETGKADKKFGRKDYSDEGDKLYTMESPYIPLTDETRDTALKAASQVTEQTTAAFVVRKPDFHPQFVKWVEEMRANLALIEERIQGSNVEFIRSAVISAKLDDVLDGNTLLLLDVFLKREEYSPIFALRQEISKAKAAEDRVQATIPLVMVMNDSKPRETRILLRGNYETPGDKVEPGIPSFLPPLPTGVKADRLALAKWLVAPEQPLMSRVVMNRLWQQFFGRGLVKTADDFGLQGSLPSHPELLDWLAVEFRESGWDVKHMVKLILTSRIYQQSARLTQELLAKDPENVLLARGPRFRLDSRFLRDQALALSGLLVDKRGGFPVMPYQPPGIWEDISFDKNRYAQGTGEDLHRRSLYTFWRRSVAPTNFFDAPSRQVCALTPSRTNTPLQALTTLNDVTYVEAARVWAQHLAPLPDDSTKLRQLLLSATAREPEARAITTLRNVLTEARDHFAASPGEADKLVGTGEAPLDRGLPTGEHAAWTTVCLLVLNLDETLTR
ncbi:MAG: PSD1 and planctomycete cytochrome C domain-containing protein [Verrucomicrobiota bacterium]